MREGMRKRERERDGERDEEILMLAYSHWMDRISMWDAARCESISQTSKISISSITMIRAGMSPFLRLFSLCFSVSPILLFIIDLFLSPHFLLETLRISSSRAQAKQDPPNPLLRTLIIPHSNLEVSLSSLFLLSIISQSSLYLLYSYWILILIYFYSSSTSPCIYRIPGISSPCWVPSTICIALSPSFLPLLLLSSPSSTLLLCFLCPSSLSPQDFDTK